VGILAVEMGVPVVPAYIKGAFEALPRGAVLPKLAKITVTFGKPVTAADIDFSQKPGQMDDYQYFASVLQERVRELSAQREVLSFSSCSSAAFLRALHPLCAQTVKGLFLDASSFRNRFPFFLVADIGEGLSRSELTNFRYSPNLRAYGLLKLFSYGFRKGRACPSCRDRYGKRASLND